MSHYSPTVINWYEIDKSQPNNICWFTLNGGGDGNGVNSNNKYDNDGYDKFGYNKHGLDRAELSQSDYCNLRTNRIGAQWAYKAFPHMHNKPINKDSPTVIAWWDRQPSWFELNGGGFGFGDKWQNKFDNDGFDCNGWSANGIDRAGIQITGYNKRATDHIKNVYKNTPIPNSETANQHYSPTIYNWRKQDTAWFTNNDGGIGIGDTDNDGYDKFGYDNKGYDRAANNKGDYAAHEIWKQVKLKWADKPVPMKRKLVASWETTTTPWFEGEHNEKSLTVSPFFANIPALINKE